MAEKKEQLEKRLQDVTGVLGTAKKQPKKGEFDVFGFELKSNTLQSLADWRSIQKPN